MNKLIVGLLQITFVVLKLCNVINWNWWLVFLPTMIFVGYVIIASLIIMIFKL